MTDTPSASHDLYQRALESLPGGVSRNTVLRSPHPLYADHASGSRITDIEGVERVDFSNNMTSLIHGHAHPAIVDAVEAQLRKGVAFAVATEVEIELAEHMISRSESFEQIRFVNSGTEAVMGTVKAARAYTGRPKIAKVEGAYHGLYDFAEVSQTSRPDNWGDERRPQSTPVAYGTPDGVLADVVVIPFNDPDTAIEILEQHRGELACVLIDPMPHRVGLVPATSEFVERLRAWTEADGSLLVFDEVITFRAEVGGFQQRYAVKPDLTALGKMIGGGFPVGAIAGARDVMQVMNPLVDDVRMPHSGTFSANPITMTAGLTAMRLFDAAAVAELNDLTEDLVASMRDAIARSGVEASVVGAGSMFRVHLSKEPPRHHRDAFMTRDRSARLKILLDHLFDEGFVMINTCAGALSTPMARTEIDTFVAAFESGLARLDP